VRLVTIASNDSDSPPVRVNDNFAINRGAAATLGALGPGQGRVVFRLLCADLLSLNGGQKAGKKKSIFVHREGLRRHGDSDRLEEVVKTERLTLDVEKKGRPLLYP
jgi:hypothetical protein